MNALNAQYIAITTCTQLDYCTSILDLIPFIPLGAGRLRRIQNGVRFLGVREQRIGASHSIQSAKIMASASTMNRVSCGRDLNCVPEISDTLAAVAKLG